MLTRFAMLALAAVSLHADPAITWNNDLSGSGTCGVLPCLPLTALSDGFVINVSAFGGGAISADQNGSESFTVTSGGVFTFTETANLTYSGIPCNPIGCPGFLSGSYSASTDFESTLTGSNLVTFTPNGPTEESFTLTATRTDDIMLPPGTDTLDANILAFATGGDPDIEGTFTVTIDPIPEPRSTGLLAVWFVFAAGIVRRVRSKRARPNFMV